MLKSSLTKFIFIISILSIFIYAFSSSYVSHNITNLAYVVAIGLDVVDSTSSANTQDSNTESQSSELDSNKIKVSFQFINTSALGDNASSAGESTSIVNSVESSSISTAINMMNTYIGKELNLSHCKVVVFSEKFAETDISEEIYTLINNTQVRPTTNIIVSKCDASYYIENSKPSLEQLVTKYYDIFPNSGKYNGYTENITIGDFFNNLVCSSCNPSAILGGLNSDTYNQNEFDNINDSISNNSNIIGKRGTENIGLALFDGGKLIGELSGLETLWHLIIQNNINTFIISIPDPKNNGEYLDLSLTQKEKTKIKVDVSNGSPYINIDIALTGKILTVDGDSIYKNETYLREISSYANSYIQDNISQYLYKTSKSFKCDIDKFGRTAAKYFLTTKDWENYNWLNSYQNAFFTVNIDTNIESGVLISET